MILLSIQITCCDNDTFNDAYNVFKYVPKDDAVVVKTKGEYDSDEDDEPPIVADVKIDAEREREFKEISENASLDDIKEIADILGVAYQVVSYLCFNLKCIDLMMYKPSLTNIYITCH